MDDYTRIAIVIEDDIVTARSTGREIAKTIGFRLLDCTLVATAISELARNITLYAGQGLITIHVLQKDGETKGLEIVATDTGPGIGDLDIVMRDGYSTSQGLGLGLPGTRRLMDTFQIESELGRGTEIKATKWLPD